MSRHLVNALDTGAPNASGKTLKYVRHSVAGFMVWPKHWDEVHHAHVGKMLAGNRNLEHGHILSAGFIAWAAPGQPVCYGRSESLGIASLPEDTEALRAEWGIESVASVNGGAA